MISVQFSVVAFGKNENNFKLQNNFQQTTEYQKGTIIGSSFIQFIASNPISSISAFIQNLL